MISDDFTVLPDATKEEKQQAYNLLWESALKRAGIISQDATFHAPLPEPSADLAQEPAE